MIRFLIAASFFFLPGLAAAQSINIENTGSYSTRMGGPDQTLGRSALDDLANANRVQREGGNDDRIDNGYGRSATDDFIRNNRALNSRARDE